MTQSPMHTTDRSSPRALRLLAEFFRLEAAGGIVLIAAALLAMVAANSPLVSVYEGFRELPVQVRFTITHFDRIVVS